MLIPTIIMLAQAAEPVHNSVASIILALGLADVLFIINIDSSAKSNIL